MNRWINLLLIGLISVSMIGCSMCCGPYDMDYPTFGGKYQRANPSYGRVGSPFSDPSSAAAGPSADSNLSTPELQREAPDEFGEDEPEDPDLGEEPNMGLDDPKEEYDDGDSLIDELEKELDELDKPSTLPEPKATPDSDETTASRLNRKRQPRGGKWR